jgi:hypothetical protein
VFVLFGKELYTFDGQQTISPKAHININTIFVVVGRKSTIQLENAIAHAISI